MEFVIKKSDLVRELQTVTGVVEKRATLPILANLLLETKDGGLQIGASDLEVTIRGQAEATVLQEGAVTLPAAKLHEIGRSLPDAEVTFKLLERNHVKITCDRTKYEIAGQPRDEFPNFPEIDESKAVKLPGRILKEMIERVAFAITTEDPRYSLNGALFMLKDKTATMVATDGHRLAYVSKTLDTKVATEDQKLIVPRKALNEISKMTSDLGDEDTVMFGQSGNHVFFIVGEHRLTSSLLEGNFPRYENVMPKSCEIGLNIATDELMAAVKRVSLLASDRYGRAVRLHLSPGKLQLDSKTEVGKAEEVLALDYDGVEMSIGFNAKYLIDFLSVVGTASVKLELNPNRDGDKSDDQRVEPGDKPGQFRPEPQGEMNYRYVVMPMHL
jgi:DNA polymerase-3 subunit beta